MHPEITLVAQLESEGLGEHYSHSATSNNFIEMAWKVCKLLGAWFWVVLYVSYNYTNSFFLLSLLFLHYCLLQHFSYIAGFSNGEVIVATWNVDFVIPLAPTVLCEPKHDPQCNFALLFNQHIMGYIQSHQNQNINLQSDPNNELS